MNDDDLAAVQEALNSKPRRFGAKAKAKAVGIGLASVAGGLAMASLGMDGHLAIVGLVMASPVLAAGVGAFVAHAWRQNYFTAIQTDVAGAEPGHLANPAAHLAWPEPIAGQVATHVADPIRALPSVTVTVHPLPEMAARRPELAWKRDPDGDE